VTADIIGLCAIAWVFVQGAGSALPLATSVCNLGLVPGELLGTVTPGTAFPMGDDLACVVDMGREPSHLLTHMFLHGSWMHLIGNMWFLWLFGNNIEDSMTRPRASGAISGVMGGYLVLFPRVRVHTLIPLGFFIQTFALPAWMMLIYWAALQLLGGFSRLGGDGEGGVAFWAHIGGFVAGVVLVKLCTTRAHLQAHQSRHWQPSGFLGRR
jgi:membrane associated rhomboid family serine protease